MGKDQYVEVNVQGTTPTRGIVRLRLKKPGEKFFVVDPKNIEQVAPNRMAVGGLKSRETYEVQIELEGQSPVTVDLPTNDYGYLGIALWEKQSGENSTMLDHQGYVEIEWKLIGDAKGFSPPDGKTQRFEGENLIISLPPNRKLQIRMALVHEWDQVVGLRC